MSKILITGATGFIGSRLCETLLKKDNEIYIIIRKTSNLNHLSSIINEINLFVYDENILNLINYFKKIKPDIVIHLASIFVGEHKESDIESLIDSNVKFPTMIMEAMKHSNCKYFINTSSYLQHFNDEDYNPMNLYAATKEAFENIIKYYAESCNIKTITLELFDTYGENDDRPKILNLLSKFAKAEKSLDMSKGEQIMDLTYVGDILEAYIIAIDLVFKKTDNTPQKYSLISKNRIKLKDLINLYEKVCDKKIPINWGGKDYRDREIMIPWSSGEKLPTWNPKINIEKGIKKCFK